eukprot:1156664-Pyramimonas_sp.AAC.1
MQSGAKRDSRGHSGGPGDLTAAVCRAVRGGTFGDTRDLAAAVCRVARRGFCAPSVDAERANCKVALRTVITPVSEESEILEGPELKDALLPPSSGVEAALEAAPPLLAH